MRAYRYQFVLGEILKEGLYNHDTKANRIRFVEGVCEQFKNDLVVQGLLDRDRFQFLVMPRQTATLKCQKIRKKEAQV